jgi:hypothetical protein
MLLSDSLIIIFRAFGLSCFRDSNNSEASANSVRDIIILFLNLMIANKLLLGQRIPRSTGSPLPISAQGRFR